MASKKHNLKENPPSASSGEDSSSSDEHVITPLPKPVTQTYGSDSSDSSSDDSDSDMVAVKKQAFEKLKAATLSSPSKSTRKRQNESGDGKKNGKKVKIQTIFSKDDEVALLKGIIDYPVETGNDPMKDFDGFFEYVKDSFQFKPRKEQIKRKIQKIREKFRKTLMRMGDDEPDQEWFALSKKVWPGGETSTPTVKSNGKAVAKSPNGKAVASSGVEKSPKGNGKAVASSGVEKSPKGKAVASSGIEKSPNGKAVASSGVEKSPNGKAAKMDVDDEKSKTADELADGWKAYNIARLELLAEESELRLKQAELALEAATS